LLFVSMLAVLIVHPNELLAASELSTANPPETSLNRP